METSLADTLPTLVRDGMLSRSETLITAEAAGTTSWSSSPPLAACGFILRYEAQQETTFAAKGTSLLKHPVPSFTWPNI